MTQTHIIRTDRSIVNPDAFKKSTNKIYIGKVMPDGELLKGYGVFRQWYVKTDTPGVYRIMHNLNRIDYGVSASKINDELVSVETSNLTYESFDVQVMKDGQPIQAGFSFSLNVIVDGD